MVSYHSLIAHSAYIDLRRSLQDEAVSQLRGNPVRSERNGRAYWYDTYRVGTSVCKTYIGEDSEELRARLARAAEIRERAQQRQKDRSRLVRLLRAEGLTGVDAATGSLLSAMAAAGVFSLGGTLVGTIAFRLYEGELGVRLTADAAAETQDLDIASFERLSLALADTETAGLETRLGDLQFEAVPSIEPGKSWRWKQTRGELNVEFLTPSFEDAEGLKPLPALGVHAQALHFLNFLIAEPVKAVAPYRSGVLVQIPAPERFAVHKLIVADRRAAGPDSLKSAKDRAQAALLIEVLAQDRPDELAEVYQDARGRGPKWRERIDRTLKRMPKTAALLEGLEQA
jgi:hypothetical protein